MAKIALITGVTGQDGSYLAEFLIKKNIIDICTILDNCSIEEISKYLIKLGKNKNFPDIKPASRSYIPGDYPQTVFTAQNGAVTTLRYGNQKINARLTLGFSNITDSEVLQILNFYQEVNSDYDFIFFHIIL